jgi:hypothetical protein
MISRIALALTIAAISTSAAAQSNRKQPTWDDLLRPVEAKTNPNVPIAPPAPAVAAQPLLPPSISPANRAPPANPNTTLLDGCVISAIGRLPKAEGLRVLKSSYEHFESGQVYQLQYQLWTISISVDLHGRQANYQWRCRINDNSSSELLLGAM